MATRCRTIINRRLYDTTVSKHLAFWYDNYGEATLYLAPDGEYFLYVWKYPYSTDIIPLTADMARSWVRDWLPEKYVELFGNEPTIE